MHQLEDHAETFATPAKRKAIYQRPQIIVLGTLAGLTQAVARNSRRRDNGVRPNNRTS